MNFAKYYHAELNKLFKKIKTSDKNIKILYRDIAYSNDLQRLFSSLHGYKIAAIYYSALWEPVLRIASNLGLRKRTEEQNWLDNNDIENLFKLSGFDIITSQKRVLLPLNLPLLTDFVNKFVANLPLINNICLLTYVIAKPMREDKKDYSVSIIVPARNEEGNISKITPSIPKFGKWQEIIFVEGHSKDSTWEKIKKETVNKNPEHTRIRAYKQRGIGKANAVRLGFSKAMGDILMIYDADRTVDAKDLPKFYDILANGRAEFANGSRLVYPMEKDAMRTLNKFGNKLFSYLFTWILGQRFKDTLCGTKAMFRKDYLKFKKFRDDPFGDFELIFGAIDKNLKVVEIPVRYKERVYGSTNISRFRHGILLFKMTWLGFQKFKAW